MQPAPLNVGGSLIGHSPDLVHNARFFLVGAPVHVDSP
jgi:hypothetical protein